MSWVTEMLIDGHGWVRSSIRWPDELAAHRSARTVRDSGRFLNIRIRVVQVDEPPTAQVSEPAQE
jgi:hypothetical protein